jgi:hypothetical protein
LLDRDFEGALQTVLKTLYLTAFTSPHTKLAVAAKIQGFALLLALFDCFPDKQDVLLQCLNIDVIFPGTQLADLVRAYLINK